MTLQFEGRNERPTLLNEKQHQIGTARLSNARRHAARLHGDDVHFRCRGKSLSASMTTKMVNIATVRGVGGVFD
jgi:hypothetical protein